MNYFKNDTVMFTSLDDNKYVGKITKVYVENNEVLCIIYNKKTYKREAIPYSNIIKIIVPDNKSAVIKWACGAKSFVTVLESSYDLDKKYGHYSYYVQYSNGKYDTIFHYQLEACVDAWTPQEYLVRMDDDYLLNLKSIHIGVF